MQQTLHTQPQRETTEKYVYLKRRALSIVRRTGLENIRLQEHLRMDRQTVHVHLRTHNIDPQDESTISWKILHSNINYRYEREVIEALKIRNYSDRIMNGCAGRNINI